MTGPDIEAIWRRVDAPDAAGDLAGRSIPGFGGALLAIDSEGIRHLLIKVAEDAALPRLPEVHGVDVRHDELRVDERPSRQYLDLACRDSSVHENFSLVVAEILQALESDQVDVVRTVETIFSRWRWFWGSPRDPLTGEMEIALFGELWFIEFWLDPVDLPVLNAWTGPSADRHDFKWPAASVEVKSTRAAGDGSANHKITRLDQLEEPESGELYLFSLRAVPDPIGTHSLDASVNRIRDKLGHSPEALRRFEERLGAAGYGPRLGTQEGNKLRVVAEELYKVSEDFPRLTRHSFENGLPNGIDRIAYTLDLMACRDWRVATAPGPESRALRRTIT